MKPIDNKPILVGGFGEKVYGSQYRMGNRVYDSRAVAMGVLAASVGNTGGQTYCYLIIEKVHNKHGGKRP